MMMMMMMISLTFDIRTSRMWYFHLLLLVCLSISLSTDLISRNHQHNCIKQVALKDILGHISILCNASGKTEVLPGYMECGVIPTLRLLSQLATSLQANCFLPLASAPQSLTAQSQLLFIKDNRYVASSLLWCAGLPIWTFVPPQKVSFQFKYEGVERLVQQTHVHLCKNSQTYHITRAQTAHVSLHTPTH